MEDASAGQEEPEPASNLAPAGVFAELARSLAEATGMVPTLQKIVDYAIVVVVRLGSGGGDRRDWPATGWVGCIDRSRLDGDGRGHRG